MDLEYAGMYDFITISSLNLSEGIATMVQFNDLAIRWYSTIVNLFIDDTSREYCTRIGWKCLVDP